MTGIVRSRYFSGEWSDWDIVDNQYTNQEKTKLSALPTNEQLNKKFGDIDTALDELHNYAQYLVEGAE